MKADIIKEGKTPSREKMKPPDPLLLPWNECCKHFVKLQPNDAARVVFEDLRFGVEHWQLQWGKMAIENGGPVDRRDWELSPYLVPKEVQEWVYEYRRDLAKITGNEGFLALQKEPVPGNASTESISAGGDAPEPGEAMPENNGSTANAVATPVPAMEVIPPPRQGKEKPQPTTGKPTVVAIDRAILEVLAKTTGSMFMIDIENYLKRRKWPGRKKKGISRKTAGKHCRKLMELGLVDYEHQTHKGAEITDEGRACVSRGKDKRN